MSSSSGPASSQAGAHRRLYSAVDGDRVRLPMHPSTARRPCLKMTTAALPGSRTTPLHAVPSFEQPDDGAFHVNSMPWWDAMIRKVRIRSNASAVGRRGRGAGLVTTDVPMQDTAIGSTVEDRAPGLQLADACGYQGRSWAMRPVGESPPTHSGGESGLFSVASSVGRAAAMPPPHDVCRLAQEGLAQRPTETRRQKLEAARKPRPRRR